MMRSLPPQFCSNASWETWSGFWPPLIIMQEPRDSVDGAISSMRKSPSFHWLGNSQAVSSHDPVPVKLARMSLPGREDSSLRDLTLVVWPPAETLYTSPCAYWDTILRLWSSIEDWLCRPRWLLDWGWVVISEYMDRWLVGCLQNLRLGEVHCMLRSQTETSWRGFVGPRREIW